METDLILSTNWNVILGGVFILLTAAILGYSSSNPQGKTTWWVLTTLACVFTIAGMFSGTSLLSTLLIDAAAFLAAAVLLTDSTPAGRRAGRIYLIIVIAAVACLLLAEWLADENAILQPSLSKLIFGLILIGFTLKLALIPLYFWLPTVVENAAPMSAALIISIVDIAAFSELAHFRLEFSSVFVDHQAVWLAVALLSMLGGALLAIGQKNIRRMLAFSTIDDMGYLLLGITLGNEFGLTGALLGAVAHAIFKVILFGAVGVAENRLSHPLTLNDHGLAKLFPKTGAAFIVASLGMIGVPPLIGFAGRWRLYLSAIELGGIYLVLAMAFATVLALFYYVRVIHRVWMGTGVSAEDVQEEPHGAAVILILLVSLAIVLGFVPAWLLSL